MVLVAGAMICALGVLDDLIELDALTKLGGQVLAAGFLVYFNDVQFRSFPAARRRPVLARPGPGARCSPWCSWSATINAVNFVDGLDGLAAGVVGIGAVAFFVFCYQLADAQRRLRWRSPAALLCAALAGACAGFLPHNFFPARIFMGDSGSMLLGLVLSGVRADADRAVRGTDLDSGRRRLGRQPAADRCCRSCCRCRSWSCRSRTWCWPSYAAPGAARCSTTRTSSTCTTGCSRSGTRHRRAVLIMWLWAGLIGFGAVVVQPVRRPADLSGAGRVVRGHRGAHVRGPAGARTAPRGVVPRAPVGGPEDFVLIFTSGRKAAKTISRERPPT